MDIQTFQRMKWLSVYGAAVALQIHDHLREGKGPPDDTAMDCFVEEAAAQADIAEAADERQIQRNLARLPPTLVERNDG
jgi:hypothetical protein